MNNEEGTITLHTEHAPILGAGGVVYRRTRQRQIEILLIKKKGGFWTLPKGHVEGNESLPKTVRREIREETGIDTEVQHGICSVAYTIIKQGGPRTKLVTYYIARARRGKPRPDKGEAIAEVKWFEQSEALRRIKRPRVRDILRQAQPIIAMLVDQSKDSKQAKARASKKRPSSKLKRTKS